MSEDDTEPDRDELLFREVWSEYTDDHLGRSTNMHIPEEFDRSEWDSVGYIPPDRRSSNEVYDWSQFYDFWRWLKEEGLIDDGE